MQFIAKQSEGQLAGWLIPDVPAWLSQATYQSLRYEGTNWWVLYTVLSLQPLLAGCPLSSGMAVSLLAVAVAVAVLCPVRGTFLTSHVARLEIASTSPHRGNFRNKLSGAGAVVGRDGRHGIPPVSRSV